MTVYKVLSLSATHVSPTTLIMLDEIATRDRKAPGDLIIGEVAAAYYVEWGALGEDRPADVPLDLWSVVSSADIRGCRAVLLDPEADVVEGLEVFEPAPDPLAQPMDAAGFRDAMDRLGLGSTDAATVADSHITTVSRWRSGGLPIPVAIQRLFRLLLERGRVPAAWLKRGSEG